MRFAHGLGAIGFKGCTDSQPISESLTAFQALPGFGCSPMNLLDLGHDLPWASHLDLLILLGGMLLSSPLFEAVELAESGVSVGIVAHFGLSPLVRALDAHGSVS